MNNSKKSVVIAVIAFTLTGALAVALFINGLFLSPLNGFVNVLAALGLTAAGLAVWYLIHNVLHEVMHALFAVLAGGKILEFAAAGVYVYTEGDKKKVKFNFTSSYAGWVSFVPKDPEKTSAILLTSLLGGLVGTVLTFGVIVLLFALTQSYYTYYLVLMGAFSVLYMFIVNYACGFVGTDGPMLFMTESGKEHFYRAAEILQTESYLFNGYPLSEIIPSDEDEDERFYCTYDVERALENGDLSEAKDIIEKIEADEKTGDNELIGAFIEKFFIACIEKNDKFVTDRNQKFLSLDDGSSVFLRAHIAYRRYTGEKDWAKLIEKNYFALLDRLPLKGFAKTEKAIYERYLADDK